MPLRFKQQLTKEDFERRQPISRIDLSEYMDVINQAVAGEGTGGVVELDDPEQKRTEKRRMTLAAKEMGGTLTAQSHGPGQGAAFTLELPIKPVGDLP